MILTFEDHEENMIDWIVSCLGIGVKSFQIQNTKTEKLKFRDLRIDFSCRKVIKNNRQECTTAAAVVRVLGGKFLEVHIHIGVIPLICLQFLNNYLKIINKNRDITLFFLRLFVEKHIMKLRANE